MLVKAFRLFVSSTFADFAQEREILQSKVFPALDAYCAAKGYQFLPLDLRWGINEEAQLDQRTAEICLGEVRAAKGYPPPNFLIMIGNRYGWVPLPYAIARDEFEAVVAWLKGHSEQEAARALGTVYQHDENHLAPRGLSTAEPDRGLLISAYTLRSREDEVPELKAAEVWAKLETQLRHALQKAADQFLKLNRIDATAHEKYFLSVTEQEIIHGLPGYNHAGETGAAFSPPRTGTDGSQAIAFIREIQGNASGTPGPISRSMAFLRKLVGNGSDRLGPVAAYIEHEPQLDALRSGIRRALPDESVVTVRVTCNANGRFDETYFVGFATAIQRKFEVAIDRHIAQVLAIEQAPNFALESERAEHGAFAEQKLKIFVRGENNLATIASYISGDGDRPLILHGRSGLGKSALMACAIADAVAARGAPSIYRFIGASAASSDIRSLLVSLVDDLAAHGIARKPDEFEEDANKFSDQIKALLSSITKPVVIFLDALDQLRKPYRLGWLPDKLPRVVKLVLSVLNDEAYEIDSGIYRTLRERLAPEAFLEIEPLGPKQGRDILIALEREGRRRLQSGQRDYIIEQFERAGGSPLYLKTSFEIARIWRSTHTAGIGHHVLADDTAALIDQFIRELSDVHHHEAEVVARTLGYLTAAKDGLSAKELTEVLSRDRAVMAAISSEKHGARTEKLPASVWVRLNRQLAPFLVEKRVDDQPLLQFFHRQVAQVARDQHYVPGKTALHAVLADYFSSRATTPEGDSSEAVYEKRSLSELPYQLFHADDRSRLDEILMSPHWMQQKLAAFGPQTLVADYDQFGRNRVQNLIGRTLRLITGICIRDQRQLLPQLLGRLTADADPKTPAFLEQVRRQIKGPMLVPQRASLTPPGDETMRLEGHIDGVHVVVKLRDAWLASGSEDNTVRVWDVKTGSQIAKLEGHGSGVIALAALPDGRLASGSYDTTVVLWDLNTLEPTARLVGHAGWVMALAPLPDGRLATASGKTIRVWDIQEATEIAHLQGHSDLITALAVLPDGRLASGSADRTIRVWDVTRRKETIRLVGHDAVVKALTVLPKGRLASSSKDKTIRVWDASDGTEIARLDGHDGWFQPLVAMSDGRLAATSTENAIRLWDVAKGTITRQLQGHLDQINSLEILPDGRLASGSKDGTIRLWNVSGSVKSSRTAHTQAINALVQSSDGRLASGSADNTVRLWDNSSATETASLVGHSHAVTTLLVLPDGRLVSGDKDGEIRFWNAEREIAQFCFAVKRGFPVVSLAALHDGRLAVGTSASAIHLCNIADGIETSRLSGHWHQVNAMIVTADGQLVSGSSDKTIRIWDVAAGVNIATLEDRDHRPTITALAILNDGKLAAGHDDGTIRLWDPKESRESSRLNGHARWVSALAMLPDGRIVSSSHDKTIRLWEPESGLEIVRIELDAEVRALVTLPDQRLVAGDALGQLHWLQIVD